jgi:hypothetical protein
MGVFTREIGMKNKKGMDLVLTDGRMVPYILDIGKEMLLQAMEN